MSEYTKGPWTCMESSGLMNVPIIDVYQESTFITVCQISNSMAAAKKIPADSIDANARLIAAAPELLEAAKEALRMFRDRGITAFYLSEAIAKAERNT